MLGIKCYECLTEKEKAYCNKFENSHILDGSRYLLHPCLNKYFSLNFFKLASSSLNFNDENATVKFDGKMVKFNDENQKDIFFTSFDDLRGYCGHGSLALFVNLSISVFSFFKFFCHLACDKISLTKL